MPNGCTEIYENEKGWLNAFSSLSKGNVKEIFHYYLIKAPRIIE